MPWRYLLGPGPLTALGARPDGLGLTFGPAGCDVRVGPADSWQTICRRLPDDWRPDAVFVQLGQGGVPVGLWSAPVPLIAMIEDGRRHGHECRHVLPRCDGIVSDADAAARLRRLGIDRLQVPARWDGGTSAVDQRSPPASRDLDLFFAGDFHAASGRADLAWASRLAHLGERWRVRLQSADASEAAPFHRARITFLPGDTAAQRRRLWQAAAAGSLPFLPAGEAVTESPWRDRHNCVRYTSADLETLLEHYLENEKERRPLAEAARATAGSPAAPGFWPELLAALQRDEAALAEHAACRAAWDTPSELLARTWQALGVNGSADPTLAADLTAAVEAAPDSLSLRHALALALAARGEHLAAAEHFRQVLEAEPRHLLAGLNRAEALLRAGQNAEAIEQARGTLARLDGLEPGDPVLLNAGAYPLGRAVFPVEWERIAWEHAGDPAGECRVKYTLLRWRLHGLLARQTGDLVHRYEAALARPDLAATRATLGSALRAAGRPAESVAHLRQAVHDNPFDAAAARLLQEVLRELGRHDEREQLAQQRRLLHRVAPQMTPAESWFWPAPTPLLAAPRPRVSLCLIVKNEESNLPACLTSVADLIAEIIVVDTGSTDATKAVARRFGAQVHDFAWCDSFAAARNESLRHATGAWIFWLDADDRFDDDNRHKLRRLFAGLTDELAAYLMRQHSLPDAVHGTTLVVDQAKLFRNDPRLRWEYRVHEQIVPAVLRLGGSARPTDIVFQHTGYQDPLLRRRKLGRNRRLLLLDQAERSDDPLTLFNLGTLHLDLGQTAEAVAFLRRSLERAPAGYSLLPRLHGLLTYGLHRLGQKVEALAVCRQGRARHADDGDLLYWEAQLLSEAGDLAGAEACLHQLLSRRPGAALACLDPGVHGYKARHQLAQLYRRQGRVVEAERQWREALAERPDFVPAWLGLVESCLAAGQGAAIEAELARLEAKGGMRQTAAVVRARLHLARREFAAARSLLEEAIAASPHSLWPRLLLGQALAREGRDRAAALRVLREVLALDPYQPEARRLLAHLEQPPAAPASEDLSP